VASNSYLTDRSTQHHLFDHLIGAGEQHSWDVRPSRRQFDEHFTQGSDLGRFQSRFHPGAAKAEQPLGLGNIV
jgi:hypothetical protein